MPFAIRLHRLFAICMIGALSVTLTGGCATNPVTGDRDFVLMSESDEVRLGQSYHGQILKQMPPYEDEALAAYVDAIGQRLAAASHRPDLDYRFTVVDSSDVNAFALPGGYIYITRGLMAYLSSEAELAAVLGHEIGHVTARHAVRQHSASTAAGVAGAVLEATTGVRGSQDVFNIFGQAMLRGYGRDHELESDRLGALYLARTGYDPKAMLEVIAVLKNQELFEAERAREEGRAPRTYHGVFATHPDNDTRLQEVVAEAEKLATGDAVQVDRTEYLRYLDGLTFGDSEREGITVGQRFLHSSLDFGLTFPEEWQIHNNPDHLLAIAPQEAALLKVQTELLKDTPSPGQYLQSKGVKRLSEGRDLSVQGTVAYTALAPVKTNLGSRVARFVVIFADQQAYIFTGIAKKQGARDDFDDQFLETATSFRRLNHEERELAKGQHLQIIKADNKTRFDSLAKRSPLREHAEKRLRLLNDMYPDGTPTAGQLLKTVR